ncbi:MAG: hypothetical protein IKL24_02900, partial [Clostridia bacterium]|nr:hypothetical protein [Clostridia bacterium]
PPSVNTESAVFRVSFSCAAKPSDRWNKKQKTRTCLRQVRGFFGERATIHSIKEGKNGQTVESRFPITEKITRLSTDKRVIFLPKSNQTEQNRGKSKQK